MKKRLFRKSWCFAIIILFVGASIVPSVISVDALKTSTVATMLTTWYVDDSGNNSNNGTSWDDAWRDINYAINYASVVDNDIIMVGDGIYYENIVVDKELDIIGNDSSVTTIDGGGAGYIVNIVGRDINDASITGFTITNTSASGIFVDFSAGITISENRINNCYRGIFFVHSNNNHIVGNIISDNEFMGIDLESTDHTTITENIIINSTYGIVISDAGFNLISLNEIGPNNTYGICFTRSWWNQIWENNFIGKIVSHAWFKNCLNIWRDNYWDDKIPFSLFYKIWGRFQIESVPQIGSPCVQFDKRPASEPN